VTLNLDLRPATVETQRTGYDALYNITDDY